MSCDVNEFGFDTNAREMVKETMRLTIETIRSLRFKCEFVNESKVEEEQILCICCGLIATPDIDYVEFWLEEVSDKIDIMSVNNRDCRRVLRRQAESIRMVAQAVRTRALKVDMN